MDARGFQTHPELFRHTVEPGRQALSHQAQIVAQLTDLAAVLRIHVHRDLLQILDEPAVKGGQRLQMGVEGRDDAGCGRSAEARARMIVVDVFDEYRVESLLALQNRPDQVPHERAQTAPPPGTQVDVRFGQEAPALVERMNLPVVEAGRRLGQCGPFRDGAVERGERVVVEAVGFLAQPLETRECIFGFMHRRHGS